MGAGKAAVAAFAAVLLLQGAAAASPLLTTKAQSGGPTIIVNGNGTEVTLHGIGWYGFNLAFAAPENLSQGYDALSQDFKDIVYRQKQLGFNAIRLAFTFDDVFGIRSPIKNYTKACTVPSASNTAENLTPNSSVYTSYEVPSGWEPTATLPQPTNGICNHDLPNNDTYDRFIYMCNYYVSQGFYLNLDFHSNYYQDQSVPKNQSFSDQGAWIQNWVQLVTDLQKTPANKGKILLDLINEPDGFNLTWEGTGEVNSSLTSYYVNAIDAIYPACPDCLYLLEGGGQYHWCGINWGNGFMTNQTIIKDNAGYNISDPTNFFNEIVTKPWINQVVLAPHIYCPGVTKATTCYSGEQLYTALDDSFGYLTVSPGWCSGSTCRVFPVILDEFGSTLNTTAEMQCMQSIETYANAQSPTSASTHSPITNWFYWAWQPDSAGTGGIMANDWRSVMWDKIGALTGGTSGFPTGLNLTPWYLQQGWSSLTPISSSQQSTTTAGRRFML